MITQDQMPLCLLRAMFFLFLFLFFLPCLLAELACPVHSVMIRCLDWERMLSSPAWALYHSSVYFQLNASDFGEIVFWNGILCSPKSALTRVFLKWIILVNDSQDDDRSADTLVRSLDEEKLYFTASDAFQQSRYFFANWLVSLLVGRRCSKTNTDKLLRRRLTRNVTTTTTAIKIVRLAFTLPADSELLTQIRYCCVCVSNLDLNFLFIF